MFACLMGLTINLAVAPSYQQFKSFSIIENICAAAAIILVTNKNLFNYSLFYLVTTVAQIFKEIAYISKHLWPFFHNRYQY